MKHSRYLQFILTVITVLLAVIAWQLGSGSRGASLVSTAHAATLQGSDWTFFPVGNQTLNRLVVWDNATHTIYDYDNHGNLENTWVVQALGQKIQKK